MIEVFKELLFSGTCIAAIALATACGDDSGPQETEGQPPSSPTTTVAATTTAAATTTGVVASTGADVEMCCAEDDEGVRTCSGCSDASAVCVARRVVGETPTAADFVCQADCVQESEAAFWCADDSSCCNAAASCDPATGVCVVGTETTSGSGSGSGSSSGSGSGSSSDEGSTGDTDGTSGTGAATDGTTAAATD